MHKGFRSNDVNDAFGSNGYSPSNITCALLILSACLWGLEETPSINLGSKTCSCLIWICCNSAQSFCNGVGEVEDEGNVGKFCSSTL